MLTGIKVNYISKGMTESKIEIINTEEVRDYIEEYVVVVHQILAKRLALDPKEIKILDWKYLGRDQ